MKTFKVIKDGTSEKLSEIEDHKAYQLNVWGSWLNSVAEKGHELKLTKVREKMCSSANGVCVTILVIYDAG